MLDHSVSLSRNATGEIHDIEVRLLGISPEHLVRPIVDEDVETLAETDESEWEAIEVRLWPDEWEKPAPHIRYHVVSGNHRTSAARKKGLATLKGKIIQAPDEKSYMVAAVKSNTRHGKNFTQEQRLALAQKLSSQGLSLSEIAKVFGVHKSTVGNWLTGRDSNAAKKRQTEETPVAYATMGAPAHNEVSAKLLGWIAVAPLQVTSDDARLALQCLPSDLQQKASQIHAWLGCMLSDERKGA